MDLWVHKMMLFQSFIDTRCKQHLLMGNITWFVQRKGLFSLIVSVAILVNIHRGAIIFALSSGWCRVGKCSI